MVQWRHREWTAELLVAWHREVRRDLYKKKRDAMCSALVWNGDCAEVFVAARLTISMTDTVSWFKATADTKELPHLKAPPSFRDEMCEDFLSVGQELRQLVRETVSRQHKELSACERAIVEHRLLPERTTNTKKMEQKDDELNRRLEIAKRRLLQAPRLLILVELVYLVSLVQSVEHAAVFLAQVFGDPKLLQIRIMAVPPLRDIKEVVPSTFVCVVTSLTRTCPSWVVRQELTGTA